jgi:hypothetical protein
MHLREVWPDVAIRCKFRDFVLSDLLGIGKGLQKNREYDQ